jgi:hypothetical protein
MPSSLEQALLFRSLQIDRLENHGTVQMRIRKFWDEHRVRIVGVLLVLSGMAVMFVNLRCGLQCYSFELSEIVKGLGEALIVAGALSIAVDPFLKKRLLHEASRGIFKHMVGFDPQPEIKDRLEQIVFKDSKLIRRRQNIRVSLGPTEDHKVLVTVETHVELETPSQSNVEFQHFLAFERAENPTVHKLTCIVPSDSRQNYEELDLALKSKTPGILEVRCPPIKIRPNTTYQLAAKYSLNLPDDFYHSYHFAYPTVEVRLVVESPTDFVIEPNETKNHVGNEWIYPGLFMPGESITIRWRRLEDKG